MDQKIICRISYLFILPILFFAAIAQADDVNNFTQLQTALDNPAVSEIAITSNNIDFDYNIQKLSARTLLMKSSALSGSSVLSGNSVFKGITASDNSSVSFEDIIFNNFKTLNPVSSSPANLGGALSINGSTASFSGKTSFTNNKAYMGAGIYASDNSYLFFASSVSFTSNQAVSGAALALAQSSAKFDDEVHFTGNFASSNGGAARTDNSSIIFDSVAYISANTSYGSGGGLYLNNSQIDFNSPAVIVANDADYAGGGLYLTGSKATFTDTAYLDLNTAGTNGGGFYAGSASTVSFKSSAYISKNETYLGGAGFYANKSLVEFEDTSQILLNKSHNMGGGFHTDNSIVIFDADTVISSNSSVYSGGGFLAGNRSEITFNGDAQISSNSSASGGGFRTDNSNIYFSNASASASFHNNKATQLGGAFAANSSTVTFDSGALFDGNTSLQSGGAVYATGSKVFFNGNTAFSDNSSSVSGGAAAITNNSFLSFGSGTIFSGNSSDKGGALYIESSSASLLNPKFYDNEAASGGAIYLTGTAVRYASVDITASSGEQAVFRGNTADGVSNALYLGNYSSASFTAQSGASIEMYDGIAGGGTNASFTFSGEGDFNFYGDSSGNTLNMTISASNGGAFNIKSGAVFEAGRLTNNAGSVFNMSNGTSEDVYISELNNSGTLSFDAFGSGDSDKIYVNGDVVLNSASGKLEVNSDLSNKNFKKIIYTLIHYEGARSGTFADLILNSSLSFSTAPIINYGDILHNWITVTLYGEETRTNFASMPGLNYNQAQVANTFDYLSDKNSGDLDTIMGLIEGLDDSEKKKALLQSSGYFLANVIKTAAAENESSYIFHKINAARNPLSKDNKFWAQYIGNALTFSGDKNSPKDYQDTSNGIMVGFDTVIESQVTAGFYGKYISHNAKQSPKNTAEINSTGLGFYSGYKDRFWEFKALASANFNENNTNRYIPFVDQKAKADFNSTTLGLDFEGATNLNATMFSYIRPYAGVELRNISYKGFTEKGAGGLNLDVDGDNYFRSALKLGASINHDNRFYSYFLGLETKYLMTGDINVIEASFDGTSASFKSKSTTEGRFVLGISAGAMVKIVNDMHIFVTGDIFKADKYENFHTNIGIRYSFNNPTSSPKYSTPDSRRSFPDSNNYAPPPPVPDDEGIVSNEDIPMGEDLYNALQP